LGVHVFHVILLLLPAVAIVPSVVVAFLPHRPLLPLPWCHRRVVAVTVAPSIAVTVVAIVSLSRLPSPSPLC
jgi:hypothetical protein